jgi:hypothetical protein
MIKQTQWFLVVQDYLIMNGITVLRKPSHLLELAPANYTTCL